VGALTVGLGLALHHIVCPVLERVFGPFTKATTMIVDANEITQPIAQREIDRVFDGNADNAAVRVEHAIHSAAVLALHRCAGEAARIGRSDVAAWYREMAKQADAEGAIRLRATAARST
jgi:hypothetical protein